MADGWIYGVLTGDLIRSTTLKKEYGDELIAFIRDTLDNAGKDNIKPYSIFRGDSFQGITRNPENALEDTIFIRLALISSKYSRNIKEEHLDARIAIGIGTIDYLSEKYSVGEGDGEAFRNSGPELDKLKTDNKKLVIKTPWDEINEEFEIHCAFFDRSFDLITPKQAEALFYYLKGFTQQEIAKKLGKSQSAISNRIKNTDYHIIEKIIATYKKKIQEELNIKRHFKDKGSEAKWLLDVGKTYFERFNYREALSNFEKSLKMAREIGDRSKEAQALHQIGMVHQLTNHFEQALESYKKSLEIARGIGNRKMEAGTLHQIGMAHQDTNQFKEAIEYYKKSLSIKQEIGDRKGEVEILIATGSAHKDLNQHDKAIEIFTDLIERFGKSENPEILESVSIAQSQVSEMKKEPKTAMLKPPCRV